MQKDLLNCAFRNTSITDFIFGYFKYSILLICDLFRLVCIWGEKRNCTQSLGANANLNWERT